LSFYFGLIHQAIRFHGDGVAVIEAEIQLPDFWRPIRGEWIYHPYLDGRTLIGAVGYDAKRGRPIFTLATPAVATTETKEEWLKTNKEIWTEVTDDEATLGIQQWDPKNQPPPEDGDFDDGFPKGDYPTGGPGDNN